MLSSTSSLRQNLRKRTEKKFLTSLCLDILWNYKVFSKAGYSTFLVVSLFSTLFAVYSNIPLWQYYYYLIFSKARNNLYGLIKIREKIMAGAIENENWLRFYNLNSLIYTLCSCFHSFNQVFSKIVNNRSVCCREGYLD